MFYAGFSRLLKRNIPQSMGEVEHPLGRGEFCVVLRRERNGLPVAMKRVVPCKNPLDHQKHLDSLRKEYERLEVLSHPCIVVIFPSPFLLGYFLMELYDYNLKNLLLSTPLSIEQRCSYLEQVLRALQHVHSRGYAHLDVKPDNVLIKGQKAVLADFGFCEPITPADQIASLLYLGDESIGSPLFMAPERFRHSNLIHPASDVWSVALSGFMIFNHGRDPWTNYKRLEPFLNDLFAGLLIPQLVRPSDCPPQLWQAFQQCWDNDFRCRPATVDHLLDALSSLAEHSENCE